MRNYTVNYFKIDGDDLLFVAENSSGFLLVDVSDGERFIGTPIEPVGGDTSNTGEGLN